MKVFISNFGKGNSLWPGCLSRPAIAAFDDAGAHQYWLQNDKPGYIAYCLANTRTQHGIPPTTGVASRWFNLVTTVVESEGDVWFHREKDELWWTKSLPGPATSEAATAPPEKTGKAQEIILHLKPDRTSVGEGKSVSVRVDLGGRRSIKKKNKKKKEAQD